MCEINANNGVEKCEMSTIAMEYLPFSCNQYWKIEWTNTRAGRALLLCGVILTLTQTMHNAGRAAVTFISPTTISLSDTFRN